METKLNNTHAQTHEKYVEQCSAKKLTEELIEIITPLWDRMDQLIETTKEISLLMMQNQNHEDLNLSQRLIDNHDLKKMLKLGNTTFFEKKALFRTYNLGKDYYLQDEVLEVIKMHEVIPAKSPKSSSRNRNVPE
ncbi:hypothetical protein [Sphingobacterium paucimobilis]|uniref:Uncharacterized protein n=1 Tax=Sphingobacterium paucimobilis HER1398 TaxID=1346330 RepID=U2J2S4_9SPHI|nr:hypothetical protein [Sphingobacterium paucimobilis]ERJ59269.1 hypothetical protein M472_10835 [Sphingobacterium paucimobilis HER1398]